MKLTGGQFCEKIISGRGLVWKHTEENVRVGLFNVLGSSVRGSNFLDAFAGSGSVGFEALSRGANFATFVDKSLGCYNLINRNAKNLNIPKHKYMILYSGFKKSCETYCGAMHYDIVFIDPPYDTGVAVKAIPLLLQNNALRKQSKVIVEHWKGERLPLRYSRMNCYMVESSGDTLLSYYKYGRAR